MGPVRVRDLPRAEVLDNDKLCIGTGIEPGRGNINNLNYIFIVLGGRLD